MYNLCNNNNNCSIPLIYNISIVNKKKKKVNIEYN